MLEFTAHKFLATCDARQAPTSLYQKFIQNERNIYNSLQIIVPFKITEIEKINNFPFILPVKRANFEWIFVSSFLFYCKYFAYFVQIFDTDYILLFLAFLLQKNSLSTGTQRRGRLGGIRNPPFKERKKVKFSTKIAKKSAVFKKIFACGAYRQALVFQTNHIIRIENFRARLWRVDYLLTYKLNNNQMESAS